MQLQALREALRRYRVANGLSYESLAADLRVVVGPERRLTSGGLRKFIMGSNASPHEQTISAIEDYLRARGGLRKGAA